MREHVVFVLLFTRAWSASRVHRKSKHLRFFVLCNCNSRKIIWQGTNTEFHGMVVDGAEVTRNAKFTPEVAESSNDKNKRKRRRKPRLTGLSKQRQTANARERNRMRSLSTALLHLRDCLPSFIVPIDKKLSKIQTLRLAIRYIATLRKILQSPTLIKV